MQESRTTNSTNIRKITIAAMFAAISTVLMYIEFPLPFLPPFLKIDLSGVAILIAAFMLGPTQAVLITLVKDLVHLLSTQTGGVGELADFILLSSFAVTASLIYRRHKDKKHALIGCAIATVCMSALGVVTNMFLLIPFYSQIMPVEAIVGACKAVNPAIDSMNGYYLFGVVPFNLIKGVILSAVTVLLYKKLSVFIRKFEQK